MPLESGIVIPTSEGVDFHLQHIQDALSYCENVSILIVKPDFSEIKSTMQRLSAADLNLLQKALSAERDQRREIFKCLGRIPEIRDTMESVERLFYTSNYSYLAPLFRLLRDHHLYAWYETLVLINAVEEMAAENKPILIKIDLFAEHDVVLAVSKTGNDYLVFTGPIVMESPSQSDGKFQQDVIGSLTKFNSDLSRELGRGRSTATGTYDLDSKAPLYSVNYLSRHAFLRQKTHHDDLLYAHHKVVTLFSGMMASSLLRERSHVLPIHMYPKLIATASALYDISKIDCEHHASQIVIKTMDSEMPLSLKLSIDSEGNVSSESPEDAGSVDDRFQLFIEYHVERARDRAYTNWQAYSYESFDLLRNWLNDKFGYISQFSKSRPDDSVEVFSRRLCRFVARLFRAEECTIYRLNFQSNEAELIRVGAFINRYDADRRLVLMKNHMSAIARALPERRRSISYRALDDIATKYCRLESGEVSIGGKEDAWLAFPKDVNIGLWGASATAVPMLVQGAPWGVIELISDHPHHFANAVRAKVESIAAGLSPFFYFQSVFDALDRVASAANDIDRSGEERRQGFLGQLREIFLCDAVAIVTRENVVDESRLPREPVGKHVHLFGFQGEWWFREGIAGRVSAKELSPFSKVKLIEDKYWAGAIGRRYDGCQNLLANIGSDARERFLERHEDRSLIFLRLGRVREADRAASEEEFILALRLRREITIDKKLIELFAFFGSFLIPVLDSFYSTETWERILRTRLGHELNKIWLNVDSTQKKLEEYIESTGKVSFKDSGDRARYSHLVGDLKRHARGIQMYSDVLSKKRDNLAFRDHPQVYLARHRMALENKVSVSLREVYSDAFMNRSEEFKTRGIAVDVFAKSEDRRIETFDWLLRDVMQALADNAKKYASAGHPLRVSVRSGAFSNVHLRISNLGPALTPDDKARLFTEGGRGTFARTKEGKGIGLFLAKTIMKEAGFDLFYTQRHPDRGLKEEGGFPVTWHDFVLVFPGKVVSSQ